MEKDVRRKGERYRYGIGEWYGRPFDKLTPAERRKLAEMQGRPKREREAMPCPSRVEAGVCPKEGGVCSLRVYRQDVDTDEVAVAEGQLGQLVTTCPVRFDENGTVFRWIGETILGHESPLVVREIGFLERTSGESAESSEDSTREDVGRIDNVLIHPELQPMHWCAVEIQAVYFSGPAMSHEYKAILSHPGDHIPFPVKLRRPDYRSSGPKRLMPQLQIKVPTLRRWGKRMAVVIDESFFSSLGKMESVNHLSSCDIVWFVVRYEETSGGFVVNPAFEHLTTLERAVEGLTAGSPVSLEVFESRIRDRLSR